MQSCGNAMFPVVLLFFQQSHRRGAARASRCTWAWVMVDSVGPLVSSWLALWCSLVRRMCWLWLWALATVPSGLSGSGLEG